MIIVRCLFLMLFATCFHGSNALAADFAAPLASHNFLTPELKPSPDSFKLAKSTFLPETYDDLGLSGRHNTKYDYNKNDCSAYPLKSCPSGSKCDKCPVGAGYRLNSCTSPYILSGGTCTCPATVTLTFANDKCIKYCDKKCIEKVCAAKTDSAFCTNGTQSCDNGCGGTFKCCIACTDTVTTKPANSSYTYSSCKDDDGTKNIQTGWACNSGYHKTSSNTCEKDCNVTNCAGYTLTSCPTNGTCSTCTKTAANCSTDGTMYRLDSCATGYSKSGDACVKAPATCEAWVKENFSNYTIYTGNNVYLSGNVAVLASGKASIANSGTLNFVGPKFFNNEICQQTSTPTLTISSPTKAFVNANNVNLSFEISKDDMLDNSCKGNWNHCYNYYADDFNNCMKNLGEDTSWCYSGSTIEKCCTQTAAIEPTAGATGTMTIENASVKSNTAVFRLGTNQTLTFKGSSILATTCAIKTDYGCRAIFAGGNSRTVNVNFTTGSETKVTGSIYMYYSSKMNVESNAVVNISSSNEAGLFVNQNGYTPTYYADQGVHNYGTIKTNTTGFHAGQVNNYSGSAFSTSSISVSSNGYPGRIKNESNAKVQIGGSCKIPGSSEYKFTGNTSSNPFSGSSCSL